MTFVGKDGWAAPRLKDAKLNTSQMRSTYLQCVTLMRRMYHDCKLVHADLSEYNILYHEESLWFIDVSQSVEHDHPHAMDFLKHDCDNITKFFQQGGVAVMNLRELFEFIITENIEDIDQYLQNIEQAVLARASTAPSAADEIAAGVFKDTFIPRKLEEIVDYEKENDKVKQDTEGSAFYQQLKQMAIHEEKEQPTTADKKLTTKTVLPKKEPKETKPSVFSLLPTAGDQTDQPSSVPSLVPVSAVSSSTVPVTATRSTAVPASASSISSPNRNQRNKVVPDVESESEDDDDDDDYSDDSDEDYSDNEDDEDGSETDEKWEERPVMTEEEAKAARKAHKKQVKAEKAEKRKTKMPKAQKRKKINAAKKHRK